MRAHLLQTGTQMFRSLLLGMIVTLLASCNAPRAVTPTPSESAPSVTSTSPQPSPVTPRVILVAPEAADAAVAGQAELALQDLASGSGMEFVRLSALPEGDPGSIALLVTMPPDPGLQAWARSHPRVQTASLGIVGLQPAPNVSLIAPDGIRYDQLGFALGYLAAMVTPEYRLGALVLEPSPANLSLARGFVAGGTYYCGLCLHAHPPYEAYPLLLDGRGADLAALGVTTLLVAPPPASLAELGLTSSSGIALVGFGDPPGEVAPSWIASADFDFAAAIGAAWAQAQGGQAGTTIPLGIRFHTLDSAFVSEGRLKLAEALLEEIVAGRIDTGVDPLTGQPR
jgi:hypothetical protein